MAQVGDAAWCQAVAEHLQVEACYQNLDWTGCVY